VIAVLGGLLAALCWGLATLASSRSSRVIGAPSTLAWVSLIGLAVALPGLVVDQPTAPVSTETLGWLLLAGLGYVLGLLLLYGAMARGPVGIAAPIASTEGAIAAVIAVLAGEPASAGLAVALGVVVAGLLLTTLSRQDGGLARAGSSFLPLCVGAALLLGLGLFGAGQVGEGAPLSWLVASGRVVGVVLVAVPLLAARRLRFDRSVLGWLLAAGVLEVAGYVAFGLGARDGVAVTAVLASQFAVVTTLGAVLMGERLERHRWAGIGIVAVGVAAVAVLRS